MKKDLLIEHFNGELVERKKNKRPIIGFDGIVTYPIFRLGGLILKNSVVMSKHFIFRTQLIPDPVLPFFLKRT